MEVAPETEKLILESQMFILEKLKSDLLEAFNNKMGDTSDTNIDNFSVRVGNILYVMNTMIERLAEQHKRIKLVKEKM